MGVIHLWKVVDTIKRKVRNLSGLRHRRFAIDTSIWLASFLHAMVDSEGVMIENAHLKGLFRFITIVDLLSLQASIHGLCVCYR